MGTKFCDQTGNTTFSVLIPVFIHSSASLSTLSKTTIYGIWKWWNIHNILVSFLFSCLFTIFPISPLFSLYLSAHPFRPQCLPGLSPFGLARRNHLTAPTRRNYRLLCTTCAASVSLRSALQESIVHLGTSTPCCNRNLSRPNHRPPRAYTEEVQFGESSHAWAEEPKEEATFFSPPVVDLAT
jgi:hypothetical protein